MTLAYWLSLFGYIALIVGALLILDQSRSWRRDWVYVRRVGKRISHSLFPPEDISQDARTGDAIPYDVRHVPPQGFRSASPSRPQAVPAHRTVSPATADGLGASVPNAAEIGQLSTSGIPSVGEQAIAPVIAMATRERIH